MLPTWEHVGKKIGVVRRLILTPCELMDLCVLIVLLLAVVSNQERETDSSVDTIPYTEHDLTSIPLSGDPEIENNDKTPSPPPAGTGDQNQTISNITMKIKPVCTPERGCNPPLNCSDVSTALSNDSNVTNVFGHQRVVKVTPEQLEYLLEAPIFTNTCILVMYYAVWCPYSVQFIPTFNIVGKLFPTQLTVVAMDFGAREQ